ncbi:MAG: redoxin family protein [Pirellulales bacterium]|nr:redoxin family protein [Pirellulales bacterium]
MHRFGWTVVAVVLALLANRTVAAADAKSDTQVEIGSSIADFAFKDIRYLPRTLADFGDKQAYVIVFTNIDCPLVKRYLPRLAELDREYRERGVQFLAVNAAAGDSILEIAYQAVKADAEFPFAKDFNGEVVRALGVERTPEVCVLDGQRRLCYRGRINGLYRLGGVFEGRVREDLKLALDDLLAGREVQVAETPVDGCLITLPSEPQPSSEVTYASHVAGLMKKHCQECHQPNTTAPFALLSYDDVKNNGEMIAEVVREQRMPPCYASDEQAEIVNRKEMTPEERDQVIAWVRGGMPLGDPSKLPEPIKAREGEWEIGTPDLIVEAPKPVKIPADGIVEYKYLLLPHVFKQDTWVQKIEILPGNHAVVHHANLAAVNPLGKFSRDAFITGYVPGGTAMMLDPNMAYLIPKGSVLALQIHYVTVGEATTDKIRVGLCFPKEPVYTQVKHFQVHDGSFVIPPGAPHHRSVASLTLKNDSTGLGMFSHMHVRGKDMVFNAIYPDGRNEVLLAIPNYNFDWQMNYRWAPRSKKFPAGTKIQVVAHFDNSKFNPYNPDATKEVREGQQTYEEMMYGFFFYTDDTQKLNIEVDPQTGVEIKKAETAQAGG